MEKKRADLVIIGSGPAGQKAAIQASKLGKKVIVVERYDSPGGNCLFSGTIPSKSFREAVIDLTRFHERSFYGDKLHMEDVSISALMSRLHKVIDEERNMVFRQFKRNGVELIHGTARFENGRELMIVDDEYRLLYQLQGDNFIIATGSLPRNPPDIPFDAEVILDSTTLLGIEKIPKSMVVLGGGVIGSEYASFFAALGTEVTVIDRKEHMLPFIDSEIGIHLQTALTDIGLHFEGKKEPEVVKRNGDRAYVKCKDGSEYEADILLYTLGRTANVESLDIENAGIKLSERGYIPVNVLFQTANPKIYAVGDVIGGATLASTSMEQGRLAARNVFGSDSHRFPTNFPYGIYTIPEISSIGYSEDELKQLDYHYEVGRAYYYEIARSSIAGSESGMFKILFHSETLEILGVHIIGRGATEVIHIGQVAMSFRAKIDYFYDQVFNYPTYAEGYRVAALNGINKIKRRI